MSTSTAWFAVDRETGIFHALDDSEKPVCGAVLAPGSLSHEQETTYDCCHDCMAALARKTA